LRDPGRQAVWQIPLSLHPVERSLRDPSRGISGREFYTNAKSLVRGILEVSRDYGFDVPTLIWDGYNIEAEALGANLVLFDDMAPAIDNVDPLIRTGKDLASLKAPDPYSSARMPMIMEALHEYKHLTGRTPLPCYCAPFTLASHCMTFENLIYQIQDNPKFVHEVMTFLTDEVIAPYMNAGLREFPDAPVADGSDAVASLPFITQDMLEEFSLQYIERLQKVCIRPAVCDNWWGDSYVEDKEGFWDLKLRATPPYLKVQDPDLWKVGLVGSVIRAQVVAPVSVSLLEPQAVQRVKPDRLHTAVFAGLHHLVIQGTGKLRRHEDLPAGRS
jgi:hypothetical protein